MAHFVARLFRNVFMLALGLFVLGLAALLLLVTLALVVGSVVWGLLTGRRTTAREQWGRFQRSAASHVWQRYRQSAAGMGTNNPGRSRTADAQDVDFRDVTPPPPRQDRLER